MTVLYWLLAFLVFGLLIFVHELGHYLCARLFGVKIREFSIGMGPKLLTYTSKKTDIQYSIGMLPFGGYVSMVGEDEESDEPNALCKKAAWKRLIIVSAGAIMNLLTGLVLMFILVLSSGPLASNTVAKYPDDSYFEENGITSSATYGLQVGDEIIAVNGTPVHIAFDMSYEIMHAGAKEVELTVRRADVVRTITVSFPSFEEQGVTFGMVDFYVGIDERNAANILTHTWYRTTGTVKMIWESLVDLVTGRYGIEAVSGPVGVADAMTEAASDGALELMLLVAVISINLGIANLLPLPALDGGRLVFILIEMIFRRPVPQKYEGFVHFIGILLLFALMIVVFFKDIVTLFS